MLCLLQIQVTLILITYVLGHEFYVASDVNHNLVRFHRHGKDGDLDWSRGFVHDCYLGP